MFNRFLPNGGGDLSLGSSYLDKKPFCNQAIIDSIESGKVIAILKDEQIKSNQKYVIDSRI